MNIDEITQCPALRDAEVPTSCRKCVLRVKRECIAERYPYGEYTLFMQHYGGDTSVKIVVRDSDGMAVWPRSEARKDKRKQRWAAFNQKRAEAGATQDIFVSDSSNSRLYQIRRKGEQE